MFTSSRRHSSHPSAAPPQEQLIFSGIERDDFTKRDRLQGWVLVETGVSSKTVPTPAGTWVLSDCLRDLDAAT